MAAFLSGLNRLARTFGVLGFLVGSSLFPILAPQRTLRAQGLSDQPTCEACFISIETVVRFGATPDLGQFSSPFTSVFALRDGSFAAIDNAQPGVFRFYDAEGSYFRTLDAAGEGPGEFTGVHDIFATDEGYLIYDVSLGRLSWVDADWNFLRSRQVQYQARRMALLPSETEVVINRTSLEAAPFGHVLEVVSLSESAPSSVFGGDGKPVDLRGGTAPLSRVIAVAGDGTIWAGRTNRYELVRYSQDGDTVGVIRREADFLPPDGRYHVPRSAAEPPPSPLLSEIIVSGDGLIWVVVLVPSENWKEALRGRTPGMVPDRHALWDSVIEVFDQSSGELLARERTPWALRDVEMTEAVGEPLLYYVAEDGLFLEATVLRLALERRNN